MTLVNCMIGVTCLYASSSKYTASSMERHSVSKATLASSMLPKAASHLFSPFCPWPPPCLKLQTFFGNLHATLPIRYSLALCQEHQKLCGVEGAEGVDFAWLPTYGKMSTPCHICSVFPAFHPSPCLPQKSIHARCGGEATEHMDGHVSSATL